MYKYKCSECGQEYDELPQYCDCGNDSFDVIEEENQPQYQNINPLYSDEDYTTCQTAKNKVDAASVVIFVICIILSIFVLFFAGNSLTTKDSSTSKKENKQKEKTASKPVENLPSIDGIWIDNKTTTTAKDNKTAPQNTVPAISKAESTKSKPQNKITVQKPVSKPANVSPKQQVKTVKNTIQTKPSKTAQTSVQKPKTTANKQTTAKNPSQNTTKTKQKPNPAAQKQALLNYKIALRNKIASNINFGAIIGDGDCVISFKISPSGKLIDRTFVKQSTNYSLNDAVYNGVMQTPAYNPPPSGYKNETMKLSVKMYGGNFEVDLN